MSLPLLARRKGLRAIDRLTQGRPGETQEAKETLQQKLGRFPTLLLHGRCVLANPIMCCTGVHYWVRKEECK